MRDFLAEEYGSRAVDRVLLWRRRGSVIQVFTVGKWRSIRTARKNQDPSKGELRRQILYSLKINGGLIPGVAPEYHRFEEVEPVKMPDDFVDNDFELRE